MHPGLLLKFDGTEIVKLTPLLRALTYGCCAVVLQVTPSGVPTDESKSTSIPLTEVTAVVSTTMLDVPAAMVTNPS